MAELTKQLLELKHLEKNKDKIEELERRAAQAEGYTKEAQVGSSMACRAAGHRHVIQSLLP